MRVRSRRATLATLALLIAVAPACTGGKKKNDGKPAPGQSTKSSSSASASATLDPGNPEDVAHKYLELWQAGDFAAAALLTDADPADVQDSHNATAKSMKATETTVTAGAVDITGDKATAAFTVKFNLRGLGEWSYDNVLPLEKVEGKWVVKWTPAVVYPGLLAGQRLAMTRSLPERGDILDALGKPLFTKKDRITVGIEPRKLKADPAPVYAALALITKADIPALKAQVAAAKPDAFVPVITYTRAEFTPLDARLRPLPGVIFRTEAEISSSSSGFARALLGKVGEASAEVLDSAGGQFQAGDKLGLSGLQAAYQARLTGTPIGEIVIKTGITTVESIKQFTGEQPQAVRTTIDTAIQTAAERALGKPTQAAALVAIRASTGEILAVANRPDNSAFNRAFVGRYPPGSTMKVVSTAALLKAGVKTTDPVPCPPKALVLGKTFHNFKGESKGGVVPFSTDFVHSCNTAFVSLVDRLKPTSMTEMASAFGVGRDYKLPMPAFSGSVPPPKDTTDLAASMIGQGQVLVSPLDMALIAAAVVSGTWRSPILVKDPAPEQPQLTSQLDPALVASLRNLMRQVVVEGTGKAAAAPGAPVSGKTGTAEFGSKPPLPTHAWFVGFRGDIAVAVIVEGGGVGGEVAAPIVGAFFKQLP
ncbi:MAG: penicillin-binding transpeptidase domain-containing protein [Actinomycetota bacterium]